MSDAYDPSFSEAKELWQLRSSASAKDLAARFGISRSSVCNFIAGRTWRHLDRT